MKKYILIGLGLAFSFASYANAQTYSFQNNLTTGSSGPDVVVLQTFLVNNGYLVMPQGVNMGYFGTITKAAVVEYQSIKGITPAVGYLGPITRAKINSTPFAQTSSSTGTLQGMAVISQALTQACPNTIGNQNFGIKIYQNNSVVKQLKFNQDGTFSVTLPAGTYAVHPDYYPDQLPTGNIMMAVNPDYMQVTPQQFTLQSGGDEILQISGGYACNSI